MSEGGADKVIVDISQGIPDDAQRAELVRWGAAYLGNDIGEDEAIRAARLGIYYRDACYKNARRRGQRLNFDQCAMLALGLLVAAMRYHRQQEGDSRVRH